MVQQPLVGQGLIIIEASRSHSHTPHSVGLPDNNTHKRETSTPQAGFEPNIPASERPQTHAATGTGGILETLAKNLSEMGN